MLPFGFGGSILYKKEVKRPIKPYFNGFWIMDRRSLFSHTVGYPRLKMEQFTISRHETGLLWYLHSRPLQEIPGSCKMCNVIFVNWGGKNNVITAH